MKVVISGGGTGGHIYPAISIINELKNKYDDIRIIYIGNSDRMEATLIPNLGIEFFGIEMQGLNRKKLWKNFSMVHKLFKSYIKIKKLYKDFKPNLVIGTGGYVTVPVVYCANRMKIKSLIFDADTNLGLATKSLAKYATTICVANKNLLLYSNCVYTGNPRGQDLYEKITRNIEENKMLFVFGSLGSKTLNDKFVDIFNSIGNEYNITYVTGKGHYDSFVSKLKNSSINVIEYLDNIDEQLSDVKIVVTRSGASIVSELHALAIPALYIPSPFVTNNEQLFNAIEICNKNGGELLEESELNSKSFNDKIGVIFKNYESIEKSLLATRVINSRDLIIEEIEKLW